MCSIFSDVEISGGISIRLDEIRVREERSDMLKKLLNVTLAVIVVAVGWFLWDIVKDRNKTINILKVIPLYKEWEPLNGQEVVSSAEPGEKLKVLRIRYGKDYMAIKVGKENGLIGWAFYQNDALEIINE
jgi:hypothetical protein